MSSRIDLESLELRRLFAADLAFGDFNLNGPVISKPNSVTTVTTLIRNLGDTAATNFTVTLKYVDVGFRADDPNADFDDANAVAVGESQAITALAGGALTSVAIELPLPETLKPGRYQLIGKVDADNTVITESRETNNTKNFGVARLLPANGNLTVNGTQGRDHISVTAQKKHTRFVVDVNGYSETFSATQISAFTIDAGDGNDQIVISGSVFNVRANGGEENDNITGGSGDDSLSGNSGRDTILGGDGNDRLGGNGGNDRLFGEAGADRLYGGAGNDFLDAGPSNDRLDGGSGSDMLLGQAGDDRFAARDNTIDQLFGASGKDTANCDDVDVRSSIETRTTK